MKYNFYKLGLSACAAAGFLLSGTLISHAQTTAHFDDVEIPEGYESIGSSLTHGDEPIPFHFSSGHVSLTGFHEIYPGVISAFDCSNATDNTTFDYTNDRSAITGEGAGGSSQYTIAYLNADWPANPTSTLPSGIGLTGAAAGSHVLSIDVTNSTYAYLWIMDNLESVSYLTLTITGYNDGVPSAEPVEFDLARISETDTIVVNTWETIDLSSLGAVDSLTFKLDTDNDWCPFYFAMDNIVTFDNDCSASYGPAEISHISIDAVAVTHSQPYPQAVLQIEYAVDETAAAEPASETFFSTTTEIYHEGLSSGTTYYYHFRTQCINGEWSDWDTLSFTTESTGIYDEYLNADIRLFPNPSQDKLYIEGLSGTHTFRIFNVNGQLVKSGAFSESIDLKGLSEGSYILNIYTPDNVLTGIKKFTKID